MKNESKIEQKKKGLEIYLSRRWDLFKTFYLLFTWIVLGIHLEIIGPTMNNLIKQTNTTYQTISYSLMSRNGGYFIANILGALLQIYVKNNCELLLAFAFLNASIVIFLTPFIENLTLLCILFSIQGLAQGITDLAGTTLLLKTWQKNVAAPINLVHLGYGFGAVFSNLIVKYFPDKTTLINDENRTEIFFNIKYPYWIVSFICLLNCLGHLVILIYQKRIEKTTKQINNQIDENLILNNQKQNQIKETPLKFSLKSCGFGSMIYGFSVSILWIFYMIFLSGNDQTFSKFFFVYVDSILKSSNSSNSSMAIWAMILFWLSYSIGRLIFAFLAIHFSVSKCLNLIWSIGFIVAILWFFLIQYLTISIEILFLLGSLTGLIFSPTFPFSFAFIDQQLLVNPFLLACFLSAGSIGAIVFQNLAGMIMDKNSRNFPFLLITCVFCSIVIYVLVSIISSINAKNRNKKANRSNPLPNEEEQQIENHLINS